ncbi:hypothetical protein [Fredinandcohnia quinoae]|uniref:Uncharacterized protein n=1 Tax=Fredinandcohnia quinoae TaxID=2918902 RepID=A0AAW5E799_9BACI|nr:hypothetical protein [Fredinandcohnia sp. SECRCQ15]MCH1625881.1 hypothetical protein [Fredinandcohnia sp. SECRCQ15]
MNPNQKENNSDPKEPSLRDDPFSRLMFGNRQQRGTDEERPEPIQKDENNQIDYSQLMNQFDEIMASVDKIKPAVKQLSPFLKFFKKKK